MFFLWGTNWILKHYYFDKLYILSIFFSAEGEQLPNSEHSATLRLRVPVPQEQKDRILVTLTQKCKCFIRLICGALLQHILITYSPIPTNPSSSITRDFIPVYE
jgi:hypothetical protein